MMLNIRLRYATPLLLGALALGSNLQAQRDEAQIKADIDFARGLAIRFQFVDLSEELIAGLEKERLSKELTEELGVAKCDVYYQGAKNEGNKDKRLELYDKAMGSYVEFLDKNPFSEFKSQAERSFIDLCNAYSSVMERNLEEALGEEAERLRTRIREVLDLGLARTGKALEDIGNDPSPEEDIERKRLMLNRGQMLITLGKASEEGTFAFGQADKILEKLAGEDESSGWGYNAFLLLTKSKIAQGQYYDATAFGEFVIEKMIPLKAEDRDLLEWGTIPAEFKAKRWELVERGMADVLLSYMALGQVNQACKWALHYYNSWNRDGFALSPIGYLSLLEVGRTLVNSGGYVGGTITNADLQWFETEEAMKNAGFSGNRNSRTAVDLALKIAQLVNDDNKQNILKVYAQKLITEIRDLPGVVLAPDVLFEAAQGEYNARNFREAYDALKGVIKALDSQDEATRRTHMPSILNYLGRTLDRMERPLEAALAYREAVTTWIGDIDNDAANANGYYKSIGVVLSRTDKDAVINRMWLEAEKKVVETGERDTDTIKFRQAERAYGEKNYEDARAKYLEITAGNDNHEKAIVKAALCLQKMKDDAGAIKEYKAYLEVFVPDPLNVLKTDAERTARNQAEAQATYYLGVLSNKAQDYPSVVAALTGYTKRFPGQTSYGPNALYLLLSAHLSLGQIPEAKAAHAILREKYGKEKVTGQGAQLIFQVLKAEQQAAVDAGDSGKAEDLKAQMAEAMHISNATTGKPNFQNLRTETTLWVELGDWEKGEAAARTTLQSFGNDASLKKSLDSFVLPDLGHCLLQQKRTQEAFEFLDPLVPDPDDDADPRKISAAVTADWCRSVCGWIEGDAMNIVEVPGVGGVANIEKASKLWLRLENREAKDNKWKCAWYELKFELLHCWYRWGLEDSVKMESCKSLIANLRQSVDVNFDGVRKECGDDVLQKRYLWLQSKAQ